MALRWDADVDAPDADSRTPLHWAAYKGFGDTIRLLLVMDARWALADREGCTPLHWAAIRGNAEACTLLLQARKLTAGSLPQHAGATAALMVVPAMKWCLYAASLPSTWSAVQVLPTTPFLQGPEFPDLPPARGAVRHWCISLMRRGRRRHSWPRTRAIATSAGILRTSKGLLAKVPDTGSP